MCLFFSAMRCYRSNVSDSLTDVMVLNRLFWCDHGEDWVKIPSEDFTDVNLVMEIMFEVAVGVVDMEVDKVADEVANMVNEKV